MDQDGVWTVARVLSVPSPEEVPSTNYAWLLFFLFSRLVFALTVPSAAILLLQVEVMYDGWPEEYDEVVRVDSDRVAPFHTFTWAVKCWVKYLNWPMWPSVVRRWRLLLVSVLL
jgi:hypothetical protein